MEELKKEELKNEEPKKEEEDTPTVEVEEQQPVYNSALQGCRNVDEFTHLNKIEEGNTFGTLIVLS